MNGNLWTDAEILAALTMRDGGVSCSRVAALLGGRTTNAIIGITNRVRVEDAAAHAGDADPDRHDATCGPDWLAAGLAARAAE